MQAHMQDDGCCQGHGKAGGGALTSKRTHTLASRKPKEKLNWLDNNTGKGLGLVIWVDRR